MAVFIFVEGFYNPRRRHSYLAICHRWRSNSVMRQGCKRGASRYAGDLDT